MKLADLREAYEYNTSKTSDILRQLALAGLAVVWIFKTGDPLHTSVPPELRLPSLLMIVALSLDFLQYVVASATWGIYNRLMEKKDPNQNRVFMANKKLNWAPLVMFWLKVCTLIVGYVFVLEYLVKLIGT